MNDRSTSASSGSRSLVPAEHKIAASGHLKTQVALAREVVNALLDDLDSLSEKFDKEASDLLFDSFGGDQDMVSKMIGFYATHHSGPAEDDTVKLAHEYVTEAGRGDHLAVVGYLLGGAKSELPVAQVGASESSDSVSDDVVPQVVETPEEPVPQKEVSSVEEVPEESAAESVSDDIRVSEDVDASEDVVDEVDVAGDFDGYSGPERVEDGEFHVQAEEPVAIESADVASEVVVAEIEPAAEEVVVSAAEEFVAEIESQADPVVAIAREVELVEPVADAPQPVVSSAPEHDFYDIAFPPAHVAKARLIVEDARKRAFEDGVPGDNLHSKARGNQIWQAKLFKAAFEAALAERPAVETADDEPEQEEIVVEAASGSEFDTESSESEEADEHYAGSEGDDDDTAEIFGDSGPDEAVDEHVSDYLPDAAEPAQFADGIDALHATGTFDPMAGEPLDETEIEDDTVFVPTSVGHAMSSALSEQSAVSEPAVVQPVVGGANVPRVAFPPRKPVVPPVPPSSGLMSSRVGVLPAAEGRPPMPPIRPRSPPATGRDT